jgi:hypothetical protein
MGSANSSGLAPVQQAAGAPREERRDGLLAAAWAVLALSGSVQAWQVFVIAFGLGIVRWTIPPAVIRERDGCFRTAAECDQPERINLPDRGAGRSRDQRFPDHRVRFRVLVLINAVSYLAAIIAPLKIDEPRLFRTGAAPSAGENFREGARYARSRPDVLWPTVLVGFFGLFSINLPVTLARPFSSRQMTVSAAASW